MAESAITFPCGGESLVGILHRPEGAARSVGVLVVVGGPQYRVGSHRQFVLTARSLASAGFPVFRFDYRGMGDSAGEPRTFESIDADVRAAIDRFCREMEHLEGVVIFALCDAASAALMYSSADNRLKGLILANPWVRTASGQARAFVRHYFLRRALQRTFWTKVLTGQVEILRSARTFLESLALARRASGAGSAVPFVQRMERGLAQFPGPVLLLLSDRDLTAREFEELAAASATWSRTLASDRVVQLRIQQSDHTFSSRAAMNRCNAAVESWLRDRFD